MQIGSLSTLPLHPCWKSHRPKLTNYNQAHFLRLPKEGIFHTFPYSLTALYNCGPLATTSTQRVCPLLSCPPLFCSTFNKPLSPLFCCGSVLSLHHPTPPPPDWIAPHLVPLPSDWETPQFHLFDFFNFFQECLVVFSVLLFVCLVG